MLIKILCHQSIAKSASEAAQVLSDIIKRPVRALDEPAPDMARAIAGWNQHYRDLLKKAIDTWYDKADTLNYQSNATELCVLGSKIARLGRAVINHYLPMWHDYVILDKTYSNQLFAHTRLDYDMHEDIEQNPGNYGVYYAEIN